MIGHLPEPAWLTVARGMAPLPRRRQPVPGMLALRSTCRELRRLFAMHCRCAMWIDLGSLANARQLLATDTTGLGRSLLIDTGFPRLKLPEAERAAALREFLAAVAAVVQRGHMIRLRMLREDVPPELFVNITDTITAAAGKGLLENVELIEIPALMSSGPGPLLLLTSVDAWGPSPMLLQGLVLVGRLRRFRATKMPAGVDIALLRGLQGLQEVELSECHYVTDLSPLADVAALSIDCCEGITALPAMRNAWLEISYCENLVDVSGLAGGHVGTLTLSNLPKVKDVSSIAAMRPLPRTVILEAMDALHDASTLVAVDRIEVLNCSSLKLAPKEDRAGMVRLVDDLSDDP